MLTRKTGNRGRRRTDSILEYPAYRPDSTIRIEQRRRNRSRSNRKVKEDRMIGFDPSTFVRASKVNDAITELMTKGKPDPTVEDDAS